MGEARELYDRYIRGKINVETFIKEVDERARGINGTAAPETVATIEEPPNTMDNYPDRIQVKHEDGAETWFVRETAVSGWEARALRAEEALGAADSMLSLILHRYSHALPADLHADLADVCRQVEAITRASRTTGRACERCDGGGWEECREGVFCPDDGVHRCLNGCEPATGRAEG